jgi:NADH-quinone oxidoreductase subunit A
VDSYLGQYAPLGLLLCVGVGFVAGSFALSRLLSPHHPTPAKLSSYECGVDPVAGDWAQTQLRYYIFAYMYLIFAVEAIFLFPWAVIFRAANRELAAVLGVEMAIFVGMLALGLVYAWRKGVLRWV